MLCCKNIQFRHSLVTIHFDIQNTAKLCLLTFKFMSAIYSPNVAAVRTSLPNILLKSLSTPALAQQNVFSPSLPAKPSPPPTNAMLPMCQERFLLICGRVFSAKTFAQLSRFLWGQQTLLQMASCQCWTDMALGDFSTDEGCNVRILL